MLPLCLRPKVLVVAEEAEESSEVGGWEVEIRLAIVTPDLETTGDQVITRYIIVSDGQATVLTL